MLSLFLCLPYLPFTVVYLTLAINVDIPQVTYEFARGDNATIPCKFVPLKPVNPIINIFWTAHPDVDGDPDIEILSAYISSAAAPTVDISSDYESRAKLQYDIPTGTANLQLISLTSADTRVHECKVSIPQDNKGKLSDTTRVVVLVAPSKPICKIQGVAEVGQNINLTCRSEEGTPTPTYQWKSYDTLNNPRPSLPPKSTVDVATGVLSLYNVTSETSGYYICTSSNKIRQQSTNLTLAVMPPSMNLASTAGFIGIGVVAFLIILVVIICCCCRKRKEEGEQYELGTQQVEEYMDKQPAEIEERQNGRVESRPEKKTNQRDQYEDYTKVEYEIQSDRYSERRDDYDDRRPRSDDRRNDRYDDRRSDRYDDRQSDRYDDRQSDRYDDRRADRYDDRQSDRYDDRRADRYDDRQSDRYDDRQSDRYDDRQSDRYDDRRADRYDDRDRTPVKPSRG
uniref:Glycoprotein A33 n=1 Tax=Astyanax mexicanus TaxID=7994 RepID=A0A3B1IPH7_ASTMX